MDQGGNVQWLAERSPLALMAVVVLGILGYALRLFADVSPTVSKALGALGTHWRHKSEERFARQGATFANLHNQILYLSNRNMVLEYESALDHTFRVQDERHHRVVDLLLAKLLEDDSIGIVPKRVTYTEFVAKYKERYPFEERPFTWTV